MTTYQITGTATNAAGLSMPFSGTINTSPAVLPPVVNSVSVVPQTAPAGTLRTITINASDPQGQPLTYTCLVSGSPATPTAQANIFTVVL